MQAKKTKQEGVSGLCELVSFLSLGRHLYIRSSLNLDCVCWGAEGWGQWGGYQYSHNIHTHTHVIRGILISCCGLQPFLPTLAWSIHVMFILLWTLTHKLTHTNWYGHAHTHTDTTPYAASNNFLLLPVGRTNVKHDGHSLGPLIFNFKIKWYQNRNDWNHTLLFSNPPISLKATRFSYFRRRKLHNTASASIAFISES